MRIQVEISITVHVNVGARWLSNHCTTSGRTKHDHIRTAFVKEYQEDGKIRIEFVKLEDSDADMNTKKYSKWSIPETSEENCMG